MQIFCENCGEEYQIDDSYLGQCFPCEKCNSLVEVPADLKTRPKNCPYCRELIQRDAVKCRHCGEFLNGQSQLQKSSCSRLVYILLALFLGGLGIHNFYARRTVQGVIQLLITLVTGWMILPLIIVGVWVLGDIIAVKRDGDGRAFR